MRKRHLPSGPCANAPPSLIPIHRILSYAQSASMVSSPSPSLLHCTPAAAANQRHKRCCKAVPCLLLRQNHRIVGLSQLRDCDHQTTAVSPDMVVAAMLQLPTPGAVNSDDKATTGDGPRCNHRRLLLRRATCAAATGENKLATVAASHYNGGDFVLQPR